MTSNTPQFFSRESTSRSNVHRPSLLPFMPDAHILRARRFTVALAVAEQSRGSMGRMSDAWQEPEPSFQALIKLESKDPHLISFESQSIDNPLLVQAPGVSSSLASSVAEIIKTSSHTPGLDIGRLRTMDSDIVSKSIALHEDVLKSAVDIRVRTPFERVDIYHDRFLLLPYRKAAMRLGRAVRQFCRVLVGNYVFETFIILVIVFNTVLLALEDPSVDVQPQPYSTMDMTLLYIYTVEMGLKITAFGFVLLKGSYIRDPWNILDFIIVITGWVEYQYARSGVNLTALRALRILRPLRSVTRVRGMRVIFLSLVGSIKLLIGSMTLLFFFYLVVSIGSLQMFMGSLRYRCMDLDSGVISTADVDMCGARSCPSNFICGKGLDNPIFGTTHFDNIMLSMITIFQCVTLEGWTSVMNQLEKTLSMWVTLFFIPIIFMGAYFFMNMTLVAMKSSFTKAMDEVANRKDKKSALEEALEEETQSAVSKDSPSPQTAETKPPLSKPLKFAAKSEFFTISDEKDIKMRQNIMDLQPQELNPNISIGSEELILGGSRDLSVSSPIHRDSSGQIEIGASIDISALHPGPYIGEITDIPLSCRERGEAILRENPSFSELDIAHQGLTDMKSTFSPVMKNPLSAEKHPDGVMKELAVNPEEDLLKLPFFFRKRQFYKSLSDIDITYEVSAKWELQLGSASDVKQLKHTQISAPAEKQKYEFFYVDPKGKTAEERSSESGLSKSREKRAERQRKEELFKKFLVLSVRCTPKEAYQRLQTLSRQQVRDQLSADAFSPTYREGAWSGFDTSPFDNSTERMSALNTMKFFLWRRGILGCIQRCLRPFSLIALDKKYFDNFMTICVVLNTVVLGINHYQIDTETEQILDKLNIMFTAIFALEMVVKMLGLGLVTYFRSRMNVFDCIIVTLSILELTLLSGTGVSGLNAIRVFRAFRVLRVARLLRWMPYMHKIMLKIGESASKFMYLGLLLLLFVIIFALFGMQLFGGRFNMQDADRATYDDFWHAFLATFQVLTMENWHNVLHNGMRAVGAYAAVYFIIWVFLGNFVLLNLFLAILLDAFEEDSEDPLQALSASPTTEDSSLKQSSRSRRKIESIRKKIEEIEQESIQSASNSIDSVFDVPRLKGVLEGNTCERSFFIFSRSNKIRLFLCKVTSSGAFEKFIMLIIALSSLKLIWETYLLKEPDNSIKLVISEDIDTVFTCLFTVELIAKCVSLGFVLDKGTYLREGWNVLDCFIVTFSLIDLSVSSINLPIIKVFRLLRVLRPLRFISHNVSMRIIVSALLESVSVLAHVTVVMLIVWLIFAILGVSLFAGKMYTCSIPDITTRSECEYYAGEWTNSPYHFDDVVSAMVTLFDLTSPENWNDTMYRAMDTTVKESAMRKNATPLAGFYMIVFLVISNFFFLNLFLGVMFDKFEKAKRENTSISEMLLLPDQYRWIEMMKLVIKTKQKIGSVGVDIGKVRSCVLAIITHWVFNAVIIFCIVANMVVMGMVYDEASADYTQVLEELNYSFTAIFVLEAALKITALGQKYFKESWNQFDFFVVVMSLLDIVLSNTVFSRGTNKIMTVGPQLARTLRVLRVSRMLRLIKSLQIMDDLIGMLSLSVPAMVNVLMLLMLVFVIFGVLGVFLFHKQESGIIIDDYNNFSNFGMSVLILIRASTGEDWNYILVDTKAVVNSWIATMFFFSFVVITTFIMYNMFVMVMLQEYENYQTNPNSSFKVFKGDLVVFNRAWNKAADSSGPGKLNTDALFVFAYEVEDIRTVKDTDGKSVIGTKYEIRKKLGAMGILPDEHGLVYYHDVLFKYIRLRHGIRSKLRTRYSKKIVEKEEYFYMKRLRKMIKMARMNAAANLKASVSRSDMKFFDVLFLKTVFSSWRGYAKNRKSKSVVSETPPMSLNYPGANSVRFEGEEDEEEIVQRVVGAPVFLSEDNLSREVKTSRMSTNFSKNRMDTQE